MLQSRNSFLRRTVGLLNTCHHLIMYWLHPLHSLPLLHSLLLHKKTLGIPTLSLPKVLATSFVIPKAMISLFVANCRNLCKSIIKLLFLGQLLYVLQIHHFLQVHLWLHHLLRLILRQLFNRFYPALPLPFLPPQVNNLGSLILHVITI